MSSPSRPPQRLQTAVHQLAEHRIGALLVLGPDHRVVGILSERDIVRVLAERGAGVLSEPLSTGDDPHGRDLHAVGHRRRRSWSA